MKNFIISGHINIETTLRVKEFPIPYFPIDFPFFGVKSGVSGVAFNVAKALCTLGDQVELITFVGKDDDGERIRNQMLKDGISDRFLMDELEETTASVILYDETGRRQIYCDLKDLQDKSLVMGEELEKAIDQCDLFIVGSQNFNRDILKKVKEKGKMIAADVHVLSDVNDEFNGDFIRAADILFLSDEKLPTEPEKFITQLKETFEHKIIVMGLGNKGLMFYERETDKILKLGPANVGKVVNTVGAGDALFSCFVHYYMEGADALEALKKAEVFAALKIMHNGAAVGFSDATMVDKVYEEQKIEVQEIC